MSSRENSKSWLDKLLWPVIVAVVGGVLTLIIYDGLFQQPPKSNESTPAPISTSIPTPIPTVTSRYTGGPFLEPISAKVGDGVFATVAYSDGSANLDWEGSYETFIHNHSDLIQEVAVGFR